MGARDEDHLGRADDPLAKATGAERDRAGRIVVGDDLTVPGHPEIFVTGDLMSLRKLPGVAEVAIQSGVYAGRRIKAQITGRGAEKPFRYRSLGAAAYICRGRALLSLGRLHLSGFPGWLGWLFFHIAFLTTGFRNRVGAILTWLLALARDDRRERSFIVHQAGRLRDVYPSLAGDAAGSAAGPSPAAGRGVSQAPGRAGPGPQRRPVSR